MGTNTTLMLGGGDFTATGTASWKTKHSAGSGAGCGGQNIPGSSGRSTDSQAGSQEPVEKHQVMKLKCRKSYDGI